jgi:hypothetical protein
MLGYIHDNLSKYNTKNRKYLITFINDFNKLIKKINNLDLDHNLKYNLMEMVRLDYDKKLKWLTPKYNSIMLGYIRNFINAKTKTILTNVSKSNDLSSFIKELESLNKIAEYPFGTYVQADKLQEIINKYKK